MFKHYEETTLALSSGVGTWESLVIFILYVSQKLVLSRGSQHMRSSYIPSRCERGTRFMMIRYRTNMARMK